MKWQKRRMQAVPLLLLRTLFVHCATEIPPANRNCNAAQATADLTRLETDPSAPADNRLGDYLLAQDPTIARRARDILKKRIFIENRQYLVPPASNGPAPTRRDGLFGLSHLAETNGLDSQTQVAFGHGLNDGTAENRYRTMQFLDALGRKAEPLKEQIASLFRDPDSRVANLTEFMTARFSSERFVPRQRIHEILGKSDDHVIVYGTTWCGWIQKQLAGLKVGGIKHELLDAANHERNLEATVLALNYTETSTGSEDQCTGYPTIVYKYKAYVGYRPDIEK